MAVLFADDFQQWATAASDRVKAAGMYPQYLGQDVALYQSEIQSLGLYPPSVVQGFGGSNSILNSLLYDTQKGNLCIVQPRYDSQSANASGYRRTFKASGDTLYVGAVIEFGGALELAGNFLFFGSTPELSAFTGTDGVGANMPITVGINNGFFTFNGSATTVQAYFRPSVVRTYLDIVFGPDYMELWINDVMALRQVRANITMKEIAFSVSKMVTAYGQSFCIYLNSLIIADNSGGFGQRIGRKVAKSAPVATVATMESTLLVSGSPTPLLTISRFATGPTTDYDSVMYGSFVSGLPFVKNDFTGVRDNKLKPYAAVVHHQSKRAQPASDGLSIHPYVTVAGQKVYGNKTLTTSTWKQYCTDVPIVAGQDFTAFNFGYEHDYTDLNKVWVDDRQETKVYGDPDALAVQTDQWWRATDLLAYDSTRFSPAGFADFNNKFFSVASDTANLPYKASETFKYGPGIHLADAGGIYPGVGIVPAAAYAQPFTIDFWCKETVDGVGSGIWLIVCNPTNLNSRLLLGGHDVSTTKMGLWNNTSNARVISTWDIPLSSTNWRHWAVVFDGTQTSIYVDGVLIGTLVYAIASFTTQAGIARRNIGGSAQAIIERYRMRSGAAWTANFDPDTIYK